MSKTHPESHVQQILDILTGYMCDRRFDLNICKTGFLIVLLLQPSPPQLPAIPSPPFAQVNHSAVILDSFIFQIKSICKIW